MSPAQGSEIDQSNLSDAAVSFDAETVIYSDDSEFLSDDETVIYAENNQFLKILSINMGGLNNKAISPEFTNLIHKHDIICIQESHFDRYDAISVEGFTLLPTMVRAEAKCRSGGIAILVRDNIFDSVDIVQNSGENFYWFTCSLCSNVLFCVSYIPPEGSRYGGISTFDALEADILELNQNNNFQICLLGDFNARTANQSDLVPFDENIEQFLHSDNPNDEMNRISIGDLGFPTERHSSDLQLNNYGKRLLEMCKSFNLCIANGRLGSDRFLGSTTCKGCSVIDYAILSPLLFTSVQHFQILPFEPMVSDAHSGISLALTCNSPYIDHPNLVNGEDISTKAVWKSESSEIFLNHLDDSDVTQFLDRLSSMTPNDISKESIELMVSECSSLLFNAADAAGMITHKIHRENKRQRQLNNKRVKRPWFDAECQRLRLQYRRSKNHRRRVNNVENFQFLKETSKAYKKCLSKHFKEYKNEFIKKLRSLKNSDPRAYWNLLNKADRRNSSTIKNVSLDAFTDHFRKLNMVDTENDNLIPEVDPLKVSEFNLELNAQITEQEVLKSINNLKLNKACASDLILNEFLKFSKHKMLVVGLGLACQGQRP